MSLPDVATLLRLRDATWPAAEVRHCGPVILRAGGGGGNRVSAASLTGAFTDADLDAAESDMRAMGQLRLFTLAQSEQALDAALAERGYGIRDATWIYAAPIDLIAANPPPVTTFDVWPPLAVQADIWAEGGIGPARLAVMHRTAGPKTAILGRINDRPAGTVFVAVAEGCAMIHALEIAPRDRRQGLARNLTQACARWGQANGASWLTLLTTVSNAASNALYASLGMRIVGRYHYRIHPEDAM